MSEEKVSILVVDDRSEVRNCLSDLLQGPGIKVIVADNHDLGMAFFPESSPNEWPDVMILGQGEQQRGAEEMMTLLQTKRKDILGRVSVIVVPLFRVALPNRGPEGQSSAQVCRLSAIANLLILVRGLVKKKTLARAAS